MHGVLVLRADAVERSTEGGNSRGLSNAVAALKAKRRLLGNKPRGKGSGRINPASQRLDAVRETKRAPRVGAGALS